MDHPRPSIFDGNNSAVEELALQQGEADIAAGRVIPHVEVVRWLESWGKPDELPAPNWLS